MAIETSKALRQAVHENCQSTSQTDSLMLMRKSELRHQHERCLSLHRGTLCEERQSDNRKGTPPLLSLIIPASILPITRAPRRSEIETPNSPKPRGERRPCKTMIAELPVTTASKRSEANKGRVQAEPPYELERNLQLVLYCNRASCRLKEHRKNMGLS